MSSLAPLSPVLLFALLVPAVMMLWGVIGRAVTARRITREKLKVLVDLTQRHGEREVGQILLENELNAAGLGSLLQRLFLGRQDLRDFGDIMNFDQILTMAGIPPTLRRVLYRSQIDTAWRDIATQSLLLALVVALVVYWFMGFSAIGILMLLATLPGGVATVILYRSRKYRNRILQQLPSAMDFINRGLRAGHPLNAALRAASVQLNDPIAKEFALVRAEVDFGRPIGAALMNMANRLGGREFAIFAVAAEINMRLGGNLAEALENLALMLRERVLLSKKIRSITSEGRTSAYIMAAFPFGVYLLISLAAPHYFDAMWAGTSWPYLVAIFFGLMAVGTLIVFSMTRPQ